MNNTISLHAARLLILVNAFGPKGAGIEGLTKLAKLDFLLRYPTFLDVLLHRRGIAWPEGSEPSDAEREAVESRMIRFKYGPWDHRYYTVIASLVGLELATFEANPRGVRVLRLTARGRELARELGSGSWAKIAGRSNVLKSNFDVSGNELREIIYREFPGIAGSPIGTEI